MATRKGRPGDPEQAPASWAPDAGDPNAWHWDSQLPASEQLSGIGEAEAPPEPEEAADDDEGLDEEAPTVLPTPAEAAALGATKEEQARRRSKTIARKQMLRERRRLVAQGLLPEVLDYDRPDKREQCRDAKRPCLYVSCRYHLYLDVNVVTGSIKINFPDKEVWQLAETCALDVAERGGITLEEVGDIMNLTRERIRQVEVSGLDKLREGDATLETFLDGRELVVGPGHPMLPVVDD